MGVSEDWLVAALARRGDGEDNRKRLVVATRSGSSISGGSGFRMSSVIRVRSRGVFGELELGGLRFGCVLGRGGTTSRKVEGDGATPRGEFPLRRILYRRDRIAAPRCRLPASAISPRDGWCDDPHSRLYNRATSLPRRERCERLHRVDLPLRRPRGDRMERRSAPRRTRKRDFSSRRPPRTFRPRRDASRSPNPICSRFSRR